MHARHKRFNTSKKDIAPALIELIVLGKRQVNQKPGRAKNTVIRCYGLPKGRDIQTET